MMRDGIIFLWAEQMGYKGAKLTEPTRTEGKIEIFSYLDGDLVHLKVKKHGHDAARALREGLLLEFLQDSK
jgi:polyhydroxybutyrate depolymerase